MITTRERIKISELFSGFARSEDKFRNDLARVIPLKDRYFLFTNMGKAAFEQVVIDAQLENTRILLPAFFPDDFVGIFRKYNITPVFSDIEKDSYHLDLHQIADSKIKNIKAIILLHTFGLPAKAEEFRQLCDDQNLLLIEDCARALGASANGNFVGSTGNYAVFSLPKCTPLRQGGIAISRQPLKSQLDIARIGVSGLLHNLTLLKIPVLNWLESAAFNTFADTPVYPREVGIYKLLPSRELDALGRFFLKSYLPAYQSAIAKKRSLAQIIKSELEPSGCRFQKNDGNHIYTSLAFTPPEGIDSKKFKHYLLKKGIKASSMWTSALGISKYAQKTWGVNPQDFPVTLNLSKNILQLPINRFQKEKETAHIISVCKEYIKHHATTN